MQHLTKINRIGFMQGRLSELINGKIQAFPWFTWESEFKIARKLGFQLMEWTIDQEKIGENPLMTPEGRDKINALKIENQIQIESLTGDCFMQAPFWKTTGAKLKKLQKQFLEVLHASAEIRITKIIVPLVDNGSIENEFQSDLLVDFFIGNLSTFKDLKINIAFESDYSATELAKFLDKLSDPSFGVNYDVGNSASLGFLPAEEIAMYGNRILNVHVKDRMLMGTTVPLGEGNADFPTVFRNLALSDYKGDFILQTAREKNGKHAEILKIYKNMTKDWIVRAGF